MEVLNAINRIICRTSLINTPRIAKYSQQKHTAAAAVVPVYSREGDNGFSVTSTGEIKPKDDKIFNAVGTTDELSSYIGLAREFAKDGEHSYTDKLKRIQCILVDINASILKSRKADQKVQRLSARHTKDLEEWIEEYSRQLPPLENYVIPGGGKACTSLHVARTICRRAERSLVSLVRSGDVDREAQVYLNRLSDFLLTVSRLACKFDKKNESIYIPRPDEDSDLKKT